MSSLNITPLSSALGAQISGVDISQPLNLEQRDAIEQALLKHQVLFFRDQPITPQQQARFAASFGDLHIHPIYPNVPEQPEILILDTAETDVRDNAIWHTDVTFVDAYPKASILRSVVAPAFGGDTLWANTATAYNELPTELRELADKLVAVHSNEYDYAGAKPDVSAEKLERYRKIFTSTVYETEHPVVRIHPISGEKSLLLGHFVKRIKGYSQADSAHLFGLLQSHVIRQENTVRWRWKA